MREYRVKEHLGKYTIQMKIVTHEKTRGLLCSYTKEIEDWVSVNQYGGSISLIHPPLRPFDTLEGAIQQAKMFCTEPIYHYID